jgi:hypothetical protein
MNDDVVIAAAVWSRRKRVPGLLAGVQIDNNEVRMGVLVLQCPQAVVPDYAKAVIVSLH